ncbi:MAG: hypothetical protein MI784_05030 [Cytophagales bacterium]|nr:hypothetical protein [Cytophagales bacterium]
MEGFLGRPRSGDIALLGEYDDVTLEVSKKRACKRIIIVPQKNNDHISGRVHIKIKSGATLTVSEGIWLDPQLHSHESRVRITIEKGGKLVTPTITTDGQRSIALTAIGTMEYNSRPGVIDRAEHRILGQSYSELVVRGNKNVRWHFTGSTTVYRDFTIAGKDNNENEKTSYSVQPGSTLTVKGNWNDYRTGVDNNSGHVVFEGNGNEQIIKNFSASGNDGEIQFNDLTIANNIRMDQRVLVTNNVSVNSGVKYIHNTWAPLAVHGDWLDRGGEQVFTGEYDHQGVAFTMSRTQVIYGTPKFQRVYTYKSSPQFVPNSKLKIDKNAKVTIVRGLQFITEKEKESGTQLGLCFVNNGELIFAGSKDRTAYLYPIADPSHLKIEGTGKVRFQHFLHSKKPGWFLMGSTVQNMPVSAWGNSLYLKPAYRSNINTHDEKAYGDDDMNPKLPWWKEMNDVNKVFPAGQGLKLYIWEKSKKPIGLDANGDLKYEDCGTNGQFFNHGDIEVEISKSGKKENHGWNLLANPYPAAIDFDLFLESKGSDNIANKNKINHSFYVFSQINKGFYAYVGAGGDNLGSVDNFPTDPSDPEYQNDNSYIAPGQGFFVYKTHEGNQKAIFKEKAKPIDLNQRNSNINLEDSYKPIQMRTSAPQKKQRRGNDFSEHLAIELKNTETGITDYSVIRFANQSSPYFLYDQDFEKLFGAEQNLFSWAKETEKQDIELAINTLPFPKADSVIQLGVDIPAYKGNFKLIFRNKKKLRDYRKIALYDKLLKIEQDIFAKNVYSFEVTPKTYNENRFELRLSLHPHLEDLTVQMPESIEALEQESIHIPVYAGAQISANKFKLSFSLKESPWKNPELNTGELTGCKLVEKNDTVWIEWSSRDNLLLDKDKKLFELVLAPKKQGIYKTAFRFLQGSFAQKTESGNEKCGELLSESTQITTLPVSKIETKAYSVNLKRLDSLNWQIQSGNKKWSKKGAGMSLKLPACPKVISKVSKSSSTHLTIADFLRLSQHLNKQTQLNTWSFLAADADNNQKVDSADLKLIQDQIFNRSVRTDGWFFFPENQADSIQSPWDLQQTDTLLVDSKSHTVTFLGVEKGKLTALQPYAAKETEKWTPLTFGKAIHTNDTLEVPLIYPLESSAKGFQLAIQNSFSSISEIKRHPGIELFESKKDSDISELLVLGKEKIIAKGDTLAWFRITDFDSKEISMEILENHSLKGLIVSGQDSLIQVQKKTLKITVPDQLLKINTADKSAVLFPSPFKNILRASIKDKVKTVRLELHDLRGKKMYAKTSTCGNGLSEHCWDVSALAPGYYTYTISFNAKSVSGKILKK